jgi:DNA-binding transcriptional LysR family regulator
MTSTRGDQWPGAGVASVLAHSRAESGALVQLLEDEPSFPFDCYALWTHRPHRPLKVRLAVDALAAAFPSS